VIAAHYLDGPEDGACKMLDSAPQSMDVPVFNSEGTSRTGFARYVLVSSHLGAKGIEAIYKLETGGDPSMN